MDELKPSSKPHVAWYYQPWIVLILTFFVLGPFGLPLIYKSPKFNRLSKIILTLLLIAYTVYLGVITVQLVKVLIKEVGNLQSTLS